MSPKEWKNGGYKEYSNKILQQSQKATQSKANFNDMVPTIVKMPAIETLKAENIFVMDDERASTQEIRPLKIVILNLMPIKITTETDLIRLLSNSPLQIEIDFLQIKIDN